MENNTPIDALKYHYWKVIRDSIQKEVTTFGVNESLDYNTTAKVVSDECQRIAVEFAEWLQHNDWHNYDYKATWFNGTVGADKTSSELFTIFLNERFK